MKLSNTAQMRKIDRYVIDNLGVPGATLMSSAAGHIAAAAMEHLSLGGCAAVFCGAGNNGGDGIAAAAFLIGRGVPVRVFFVGSEEKLTADSSEMRRRLVSLGGRLEAFSDATDIRQYLHRCDVIIDALFGIGLNSALRGDALKAVEIINNSAAYTISADIPSGVDADTGAVLGDAVKADMTVTFTLAKPGHFVEPGCIRCGELRVCDIGIPLDLAETIQSGVSAVGPDDVALPKRRPDSHKGNYGRCLIVAGSLGYTGAPALAARAASRMGAGLVFLGVPEAIYNIMAVKCDEEMPFPLPDNGHGGLAANAASSLLRQASNCDACLIGPGLGASPDLTELVSSAIRLIEAPIILDADGINAIAGDPGILDTASGPLILTPHMGEFARLTGGPPPGDRLGAARDFAHAHNCALVLKGHRTITALPDGSAFINTTGGPAMAKGGTGDVLAGMITALIGQKLETKDAVLSAVYLHGLAGDMCAAEYGEYSVTAGDIISMLPKAVKLGGNYEKKIDN
ncbi:MAG: NAD(P)H-hydrate dehydratase [Oscillospiraceae bacterium]|jgi:NAD(P)H-hydrate epimerase|nr:NAD(P)H-hydrate dehydratase [Oscillospiraceae bacterium]